MQAPTTNRITQAQHGQYNAVDYSAKDASGNWNKTFYAPEAGKITAYGPSGTCGNRLELTAGSNRHGFCHLESALVSVGQNVAKGQAIGVMGYTGYTIPEGVNGTHLHWVINRNGVYVYPPSLVNETAQGGQIMDTEAKVRAQYYTLRGSEGTSAEVKSWVGKSYEQFNAVARPEVDSREAHKRNLESAVANLTRERDEARAQVASLTSQLASTQDQITKLTAQLTESQAQYQGSVEAYKQLEAQHKAQIEELNRVIEIKDNEIKRLTTELANCGGESLTWSQHLVLGIKGLLNALNPLSK